MISGAAPWEKEFDAVMGRGAGSGAAVGAGELEKERARLTLALQWSQMTPSRMLAGRRGSRHKQHKHTSSETGVSRDHTVSKLVGIGSAVGANPGVPSSQRTNGP